jgi:hypothetical protein
MTKRSAKRLAQGVLGLLASGFLAALIANASVRAFKTPPNIPDYDGQKLICSSPGIPWSFSVYCELKGNT